MSRWTNQQRDIILAGAIGDAIGYKIEFSKLHDIETMYGPGGLCFFDIKDEELVVSDDTQMTLFAMEAMAEHAEITKQNIFDSYYQWFLTQHVTKVKDATSKLALFESMQHPRAPGMTCLSSLSSGKNDANNDSKGCGAVMRAAPFGFYDDIEQCMHASYNQAYVTHQHRDGYISSVAMSLLVHLGLNSKLDLKEAMKKVIIELELYYGEYSNNVKAVLANAIKYSERDRNWFSYDSLYNLGEGWVGDEALAIAAYCVLTASTFEECVQHAINHNGDSDSTGSIAGQLWAAYVGLPDQYKDWDKRLDIADAFEYIMSLD